MRTLLEIREKIKHLYAQNDVFILPVAKFLLAFLTFNILNAKLGYFTRLDSLSVVLMAALVCSFLPVGATIFVAALFCLAHLYTLSMEVALVGLCVFLLLFMVYFRFSPKEAPALLITPILFVLKIPYVAPILFGLVATPACAVSMSCGILLYYFINSVTTNAATVATMSDDEMIAKLRLVVDALLSNKAMLVLMVAFSLTLIVVYLLRRLPVTYAWTIAMVSGVIVNLIALLVGDLFYDTNMSIGGAILGSLLALVLAKILEFFRFCVDYTRTERVQFEDDEYYYYVKAVPKITVPGASKKVKKINTARSKSTARPQPAARTVTTERTATATGAKRQPIQAQGRSLTYSGENLDEEFFEDFEEL